jgi:hypothetical protein
MSRLKTFLVFLLLFSAAFGAEGQIDIVSTYLKINIRQQDSSRLVLKETYTLNKSSDSAYKKKYLSQREEYDIVGRSSLQLYYDESGEMLSKIIRFYPSANTEKAVFQQRGAAVDSVVYIYNVRRQRLAEYWTWGDNATSDTVRYHYDPNYNLLGVSINYLGKSKRDSLLYRGGLLEKVWTFDAAEKLQKEMEFFYLDSALLKITHRNAKRIILEEEFFFYNGAGKIEKTITKLYPEGEEKSRTPPTRLQTHKYRGNGSRRRTLIRNYDSNKKLTGTTQMTYDKQENIVYLFLHSKGAGVYEKTWLVYTKRRK